MIGPSIFGDTYGGVPNPFVPHAHPYPTRYHGPLWHEVRAGGIYQPGVYRMPIVDMPAVGASPDGLGAFETAGSGTQMLLRFVAGAALGVGAGMGAGKTAFPATIIAAAAAAAAVLFGPEGMTGSIIAITFATHRRAP